MKPDPNDTSGPDPQPPKVENTPKSDVDGGMITHVTHRAMATDFVVMLPEHAADAVEVVVVALEMLDSIEESLTIYQAGSEISRLNRDGAAGPVKLSQSTFELLEKSILWSRRTNGAFDVTAGPLVEAWGFTRRAGSKPTGEEIETALRRVGYANILLDAEARTARFAVPGMAINLGAIGKGDALDRLAAHLKKSGVMDFLIHGGNSSLIGAGNQSLGNPRGWAVGLAHPTKPQRRLGGIWLKDQSLATSGSGKQFFHHQGRRYGHVIDPRTGYPAGNLMSLTVLMPSAADADAAATGLFVAGSEWIRNRVDDEDDNDIEADSLDECESDQDWTRSPMILAAQGIRQDEVDVETMGTIDWIDPPKSMSASSPRLEQRKG
ncbi:Thiamine biosynthesis lipoprotein ApbE precursor [Rubripirellula tenax]|uniref:FAD:protein FMN transferase n=1 Tax=Rubripirellula tenax TaxID=2528015 RepID=A0A5C6ELJ8_9BACT|nr:FAD:protein FMN transferase [Rubripirellula tenax]TWU48496.1 Thiamine biosynthesis lipoprotein ApbE precursor [Rubripirellula tenax]